ncbi:unnamed protein product [Phytomonas sp. Hart1]|nr:unnamed protein product [Phytomonas sp. Hart1]|eukprot:CCW67899.1 unnamed protein product [Phytomonas sp. isolate Hart1]
MTHWKQVLTAERDMYTIMLNQFHQQLELRDGLVRSSASRATTMKNAVKNKILASDDVLSNMRDVEKLFGQALCERDAAKTALRDEKMSFAEERTKMNLEIDRLKCACANAEGKCNAQSRLVSELRSQIDQHHRDAEERAEKLASRDMVLKNELQTVNEKYLKEVEVLQTRLQHTTASFREQEEKRQEEHRKQLSECHLTLTRERDEAILKQKQSEVEFKRGQSALTQQLRQTEEQIKALQNLVSAGEDQIEVLEEALRKSEVSLRAALNWQKEMAATHTAEIQHMNDPSGSEDAQNGSQDGSTGKQANAAMSTSETQAIRNKETPFCWYTFFGSSLLDHLAACHRLEEKWYRKKHDLLIRELKRDLPASRQARDSEVSPQSLPTKRRSYHESRFRDKKSLTGEFQSSGEVASDGGSDSLGLEYELNEYKRMVASLKEALWKHEEARRIDHSTINILKQLLKLQNEEEIFSTGQRDNCGLPAGVAQWREVLSQLTPSAPLENVTPPFHLRQELEINRIGGISLNPETREVYCCRKSENNSVDPVQSVEAYRMQYVALQAELKKSLENSDDLFCSLD